MRLNVFLSSTLVLALVAASTVANAQTQTTRTRKTVTTTTLAPTATTPADSVRHDVDAPVVGQPFHEDVADANKIGFDGFIDLKGRVTNRNDTPDRGFTVNDAALMVRKNFNYAEALLDLPFYTQTGSTTNNFNFGTSYAQAYLNFHNFSDLPVFVRIGQFDSFFGIESNHSKDRFFADRGLMKEMLPWTHTGALFGYRLMQKVTLQALVANGPKQTATNALVSSTMSSGGSMANSNPEAALQAKYDADHIFGGIGYMVSKSYNAGLGGSGRIGHLIDVTGGYKQNEFSAAAEFLYKKNANLTGSYPPYKDTKGFAVLGDYAFMPRMSAGARIEYAADPVLLNNQANGIFEVALGPVYRLERNITLRGDFTYAHIDNNTGSAILKGNDYGFLASAVASLF